MDNPNTEGVNFHYNDNPTNAGAVTSNYAYKTEGNEAKVVQTSKEGDNNRQRSVFRLECTVSQKQWQEN